MTESNNTTAYSNAPGNFTREGQASNLARNNQTNVEVTTVKNTSLL